MKTKHTPGPWTLDETWGLIMAKDVEIAACHSGIKANAQLIAAAPDMLEALESAVPLLKMYCEDRYNSSDDSLILSVDAKADARLILDIEALIRKAKGEV